MKIKFFLLQKSSILGNFDRNFKVIESAYKKACSKQCDFLLTTELFLTGYPPQDLINRIDFHERINFFKKKLIKITQNKKTILMLNIPQKEKGEVFNVLLLLKNGAIIYTKNKSILPNYGVFDEKRYFSTKKIDSTFFSYKQKKIKFLICEEMWSKKFLDLNKSVKPDLLIVINASPFEIDKFSQRKKIAKENVKAYRCGLIYLNHIGCQDELIFDGGSFYMNKSEKILFQEKFFFESETILDLNKLNFIKKNKIIHNKVGLLYEALVYSLQSYMKNNGFENATIGLSGGIDSALCTMIATDAVGSKNVRPVFMPTTFTSKESKNDSESLSKNLNLEIIKIPIELLRKKILSELNFLFKNFSEDITEENIQSRIRGLILMAISNKYKSLLIATGNKSELSVGYSTLYGDMCGGFSLIKDIYKTQIFELVKWRNECLPENTKFKKLQLMPHSIITKDPSAELKFNQKDTDSLPSYQILDKILEYLIDKNYNIKKIKKFGFKEVMIKKVWKMVKNSEFKRYQSAIGPKVSSMSFDKDRRFPIANKFSI